MSLATRVRRLEQAREPKGRRVCLVAQDLGGDELIVCNNGECEHMTREQMDERWPERYLLLINMNPELI